jgi:hypothetical protein
MYYYYDKFPHIGIFYIKRNEANKKYWDLMINDFVRTYTFPQYAVQAVHNQLTGYKPWDKVKLEPHPPQFLSEWGKVYE